jgi:uncharacterized membrane protein/nitrite reductase/ring-hydroxylating ferredoxin subunit
MRSRASYKGHPIHPALIPFPFAFLTGAFGFDAMGWALGRGSFWTTGRYLVIAGVVAALVAAIPGLIDYLYSVPPDSTGKQRATRHMLLNLSVVVLFVAALLGRQDSPPTPRIVALEGLAVGLMSMAAWMGGVLVSRNQIGVDHRYAGAGKWKESWFDAEPGEPLVVADCRELGVNQMKLLHIGDRRVVLARVEHGFVAFDDRCPHRGGSLAGGTMICGTVQCPWHGSQFDTRTGTVKAGPAHNPINAYRAEERDGKIVLQL